MPKCLVKWRNRPFSGGEKFVKSLQIKILNQCKAERQAAPTGVLMALEKLTLTYIQKRKCSTCISDF